MNIAVVAAEVAPWSKTGGLGDVCGALPKALAALGHRVLTIAPRYKAYPDAWDTGVRARVHLFGHGHDVAFFHATTHGVHHLFVDHPSFHRPGIYGDSNGAYGDNLFRFALLSRAAIEAVARVPLDGVPLGEDVVRTNWEGFAGEACVASFMEYVAAMDERGVTVTPGDKMADRPSLRAAGYKDLPRGETRGK